MSATLPAMTQDQIVIVILVAMLFGAFLALIGIPIFLFWRGPTSKNTIKIPLLKIRLSKPELVVFGAGYLLFIYAFSALLAAPNLRRETEPATPTSVPQPQVAGAPKLGTAGMKGSQPNQQTNSVDPDPKQPERPVPAPSTPPSDIPNQGPPQGQQAPAPKPPVDTRRTEKPPSDSPKKAAIFIEASDPAMRGELKKMLDQLQFQTTENLSEASATLTGKIDVQRIYGGRFQVKISGTIADRQKLVLARWENEPWTQKILHDDDMSIARELDSFMRKSELDIADKIITAVSQLKQR